MATKFGISPDKLTELTDKINDLQLECNHGKLPKLRGAKPTKPAALEARLRRLQELLAEDDTRKASAATPAEKTKE